MTGSQPEKKMKNFVELIHLMTVVDAVNETCES